MKHLVTSIGEILIDFLPVVEQGRTVGFRMHAGGSLMNVAITVARLGHPSALAIKISTDMFGRFLRSFVEEQGVDTRFLLNDEAQTTLAFVTMIDNEPQYSFYTTETADTLLRADELPAALFDETRILHFGSISLLRGSTPEAVLATVERLKGKALLSFDPNLRPTLIRDEAAYRAVLERSLRLADVVKISGADLAWLAPAQSVEAAATDLLRFGTALVVVTLGGSGVLAMRGDPDAPRALRLPAFSVTVADTVGAGDSFAGGLLTCLAEREVVSRAALEGMPDDDLRSCIRFAAGVAAITCSRAGADPPDRPTVEALLKQDATAS